MDTKFYDICNQAQEIAIIGYGVYGKYTYELLKNRYNNNKEFSIYDNYKHGNTVDRKIIRQINPDSLAKVKDGGIFLISSTKNSVVDKLYEQLKKNGIKEEKIIRGIPNEIVINRNKEVIEKRKKILVPENLKFEINITKSCNLNCKSCCHFAPLANKDDFMDIHIFKKDINRMSEIFDGQAKRILLLGGEPLLHQNIIDFMEYTRKAFLSAKIEIVTNGLLVKNMQENFFDACKYYDIKISPTQYPIRLDYHDLGEFVKSYGVEYSLLNEEAYSSIEDREKNFIRYPFDFDKKQDPKNSYIHCSMSDCITLEKGRLYTCSLIPNVYLFNNYFKKNLSVSVNDYVDIYKDIDRYEIMKRLSVPVDFCGYCNTVHAERIAWGISNKDIKEWS